MGKKRVGIKMYKKLLLSAGGGIISQNQQSPQAEAATVAIGLGGTGISCLRELKKQVYNELLPDNVGEAVPKYEHIRFLAVDCDRGSLGDDGSIYAIDKETEFFDIGDKNIAGLLNKKAVPEIDKYLDRLGLNDHDKGIKDLPILSATDGAGGVRQAGRFLLFVRSHDLRRR